MCPFFEIDARSIDPKREHVKRNFVCFSDTMSLEGVIEKQLRQAIERGEFDDLKGKGQPLDLTAYFDTPEDLRMAHSILKSNQFVPEEVDIMNRIARLKKKISETEDEVEKNALKRELNSQILALDLTMERKKRRQRSF